MNWMRVFRGPVASFPARFSMPTTTTRILAVSTVLKTRAVGLYLVYVTVFRYTFRPLGGERALERRGTGSESVNNGRNRPAD